MQYLNIAIKLFNDLDQVEKIEVLLWIATKWELHQEDISLIDDVVHRFLQSPQGGKVLDYLFKR